MHAKRLTRRQLVSLFNEHGYPIGKSTLDKLCMPAVNEGPPVAAWWGRRPLYDPNEALDWAEKRTRPPVPAAPESTATQRGLHDGRERMTTKPDPGDVSAGRVAHARSDHPATPPTRSTLR